jgi:hypothetical protein
MPTTADEIEPTLALIQAIVRTEVVPRLASFTKEGCRNLHPTVFIAVRQRLLLIENCGLPETTNEDPNGEMRIRVRKTFDMNRVVWRIESIFPDIMPSTGFTGFDSSGDAVWNQTDWFIRPKDWIGKYNLTKWRGWT